MYLTTWKIKMIPLDLFLYVELIQLKTLIFFRSPSDIKFNCSYNIVGSCEDNCIIISY